MIENLYYVPISHFTHKKTFKKNLPDLNKYVPFLSVLIPHYSN